MGFLTMCGGQVSCDAVCPGFSVAMETPDVDQMCQHHTGDVDCIVAEIGGDCAAAGDADGWNNLLATCLSYGQGPPAPDNDNATSNSEVLDSEETPAPNNDSMA